MLAIEWQSVEAEGAGDLGKGERLDAERSRIIEWLQREHRFEEENPASGAVVRRELHFLTETLEPIAQAYPDAQRPSRKERQIWFHGLWRVELLSL